MTGKTARFLKTLPKHKALAAGLVGAAIVLAAGTALVIRGCGHPGKSAAETGYVYQCPMHPQIVQGKPGICPICHMNLDKVASGRKPGQADSRDRKVLRYRNPMDPTKFSDKPMKDSMGMDYIPVYADDAAGIKGSGVTGKASFVLSDRRQQLIGVKTAAVEIRALSRRLRLPGRVSGPRNLVAELLEMDAGTVRPGMKARVSGPQDQSLDAVVTGVDPNFDALTRSYSVSLETGGDAGWLRPGAYCEVDVMLDFGKRLAIPGDAVLYSGERNVVFLADGRGGFEPREVRLGKTGDDWVEVLSGLKKGDRIVTSANFLIDSESRFKSALEQF